MPNQHNLDVVRQLEIKFKESKGIVFANYQGMSVKQATSLRNEFTKNDVEFYVSKNTLTKIAAYNSGIEKGILDKILTGQIAIAYSKDDPSAPAKVIKDFSKENECLDVVGLLIDGEFFDPGKFKQLANLPSREELLTKFVLCLNSPMTNLASVFGSTMQKMVMVLNAVKDKKEN